MLEPLACVLPILVFLLPFFPLLWLWSSENFHLYSRQHWGNFGKVFRCRLCHLVFIFLLPIGSFLSDAHLGHAPIFYVPPATLHQGKCWLSEQVLEAERRWEANVASSGLCWTEPSVALMAAVMPCVGGAVTQGCLSSWAERRHSWMHILQGRQVKNKVIFKNNSDLFCT